MPDLSRATSSFNQVLATLETQFQSLESRGLPAEASVMLLAAMVAPRLERANITLDQFNEMVEKVLPARPAPTPF